MIRTSCVISLEFDLINQEPPTEVVSAKIDPSKNLDEDSATVELRLKTVEKLWSLTEDLNVLYKENWTRLAAREVLDFQDSLVRGLRRPSIYEPLSPRRRSRRWTFSSSLLYSLTLITTIGKSHLCREIKLWQFRHGAKIASQSYTLYNPINLSLK